MSKYEWERGTIKIPSKEWPKFRTAVIKAWNASELDRLERAKRLHAEVSAKVKGKRGSKRQEVLARLYLDGFGRDAYDVRDLVVSCTWDDAKKRQVYKLRGVPRKKDLEVLPTSKDATIHMPDASVTLSNKARSVTWDVPENNHAGEHARSHPVARKLFRLLDRMTWTRGSGGEIVGNDEYNREADYAGGGGNYVVAEYSAAAQKRRTKARSSLGGLGGGFGRRW